MSEARDAAVNEHDDQSRQGITFLWGMIMVAGFVVLFGLTQWGVLDDVPVSEVGLFAVGSANAIGIIAIGGWNAIGIVSIGGANSIGLVAVGGFNSIGVISFGGVASYGLISIGGINGFGTLVGVRIFQWSPVIVRRKRQSE